MSEIKALEKLRGLSKRMDSIAAMESEHGFSPWSMKISHIADEIEIEINERYTLLPLDAEGLPIHIGDYLESEELGGKRFPCRGLNVEVCGEGKRWTVCTSYDSYSGTSEYEAANRCTHVKPRTLEDVLDDFANSVREEDGYSLKDVKRCAEVIRELMGEGK